MIDATLIGAGCALALSLAVGLVAHEWAHATVLRLAGVDYAISYLPGRPDGIVGLVTTHPWAVVVPHPTGHEPAWVLRLAALAPATLAVPVFGLGLAGSVSIDSPVVAATAIGWLACALPSPQDFSVAFYADRLLERSRTLNTATGPRAD